jgi:drug/metabolite transporter (DMT)-like permease
MPATLATLLLLLGSVACDVTGQVCFKLGVGHETDGDTDAPSLLHKVLHSPWIALGVAVYALEFVLWFAALSRTQLSIAFPFTALGYVGVVLASRYVLNERISLRRWAGIGTIVVGVVLVTGQNLG